MTRRTGRKRSWRRRRIRGWSRTTVWRLRLSLGLRLGSEPVLVALERTAREQLGVLRVQIPHLGIELVVCRGIVAWWRRMAIVARTLTALREALTAWETAMGDRGLRSWLSEPIAVGYMRDPKKLEAVLCRALVMEVLGRRGRPRR